MVVRAALGGQKRVLTSSLVGERCSRHPEHAALIGMAAHSLAVPADLAA
jgi:hypothetical protein